MKIYLSGPMRGQPNNNHYEFNQAAKILRDVYDWEIFNPAEQDIKLGVKSDAEFSRADLRRALSADLRWLCEHADGIALLPRWQDSEGAKAELQTATALGLRVYNLAPVSYQMTEIEVQSALIVVDGRVGVYP